MSGSDTNSVMFETIAIVGVGLMGGSLGMAARNRRLAHRVVGIGRTEQKLMRAKILGAIDDYSLDAPAAVSEADLVIICTPVRLVVPTLSGFAGRLKKGAIVTDVGSTKREIVRDSEAIMPSGRYFVGGHPMAGSEQAGVEAAFPDLYLGATYVLTAAEQTDLGALGKMVEFAEGIGARAEVMSPEEHDAAAAVISHLPHAMAAALLHTAEDSQRESGKVFRLAAGSFRDLTRISDSLPGLWRDICITNADSLSETIRRFVESLEQFRAALDARDEEAIVRFFEQAHEIRQAYLRVTK